jgi:hypothetical protein
LQLGQKLQKHEGKYLFNHNSLLDLQKATVLSGNEKKGSIR